MSRKSHDPSDGSHSGYAPHHEPLTVSDQLHEGLAVVRANVQETPYATLGLALGMGVLLGGGMWRVLARSLVGAGARLAVALVIPALIDNNQRHNQNPQQEA